MTVKRFTGNAILPGALGSRQIGQMPAGKLAVPQIQVRRWVRNGTHPNAEYESIKNESLMQSAVYQTKPYVNLYGSISQPAPSSNSWDRWRWAFKSGPHAHAAVISVQLTVQVGSLSAENQYAELRLHTSATEAATVATQQFNYGSSAATGSAPQGWRYMRDFTDYIPITPNTTYYALLRSVNYARIQGVTMLELASLTENMAGYLPCNISSHHPVLDVYRQQQRTLIKDLTEKAPPLVFNWTVERGGTFASGNGNGAFSPANYWKTTASATGQNILDWDLAGGGSTAVNANTPGWYPDMREKDTLRANTVPCTLFAYGQKLTGAGTGGNVSLKDTTGATIAQLNNVFTTTAGWQSVAFNMPTTATKVDVHFSSPGGVDTFGLGAVTIVEG